MITFDTTLLQFEEHGDKTGWAYVSIPADVAKSLFPNNKKAFRVKGFLDKFPINNVSVLPAGDGSFIMAVNASMRKGIHKKRGAMVSVSLQKDDTGLVLDVDLVNCLADAPEAKSFFNSLAPSHQRYFSNWISEAKTESTKTKRLAHTIAALDKQMDFGSMIRSLKKVQ